MTAAADDWRRMAQGLTLPPGTLFERKAYHPYSETWEHDHCELCWATFMDPTFSEKHRQLVETHPEHQTEGYATTDAHPQGAEYHWVCTMCWDDFAEEYGLRLVQPRGAG